MADVPLPEPDGVIAAMWNVVRHGPNYDGRQNDVIAAAKAYAERYAAAFSAAKDAEIAGLRAELLKQWAVLYEAAKAGHEQAFAEAQNAAAVSAADNAALRERVKVLEDALNAMLTHMGMDEDEWNKPTFDQARSALERKP